MPEGPTIHRLAGELTRLVGPPLAASSPQGRFSGGADQLDGTQLEAVEAFGKHLVARFSADRFLHIHLGMAGRWLWSDSATAPMPQVRLRLASTSTAWNLIAPLACELLDQLAVDELAARLGPDPLRPDADAQAAQQSLGAARGPIGAALLDQSVVGGVGNVIRCEALHALGVAPGRLGRELTKAELAALWSTLQQMMTRAVADGRIITVEAADRLALAESESRKVYKQLRCRDCGADVVRSQVGGRTSYHCPVEQPR